MRTEDEIHELVRDRYGEIARSGSMLPGGGCCGRAPRTVAKSVGYSDAELAAVPEGANLGLGCGAPLAHAALRPGETVLDLGSGAGFDAFLAARAVGEAGRVIGVDMTADMLERARRNAEEAAHRNVEFRQGHIEALPVADASVDVVISNCVINLVPDKARVYREVARVLRPGGRLVVSDIVLEKPLPTLVAESVAAFTGCVAGASLRDDYLATIRAARLVDVEIVEDTGFSEMALDMVPRDLPKQVEAAGIDVHALAATVRSIKVRAQKPLPPAMPTATATRQRKNIRFRSGSDECDAWLYLPEGASASRRVPVIVMAHGLGGVKRVRLDAFAERFRDAGYACLVFDYRHFGDSGGEPRELVDIARQHEDYHAAVHFARGIPEVDPERVIVWGTSLAGGHAIVTAAGDRRIAAAIAQCPFTDGLASARTVDLKTSAKLTLLALRDRAAKLLGRPPVRVPGVAQPGEVALMTAPDALTGVRALLEAAGATDIPDQIPARIALDLPRYLPGRRAKDVRCPILFCVSETDSGAPARATVRHAARAPKGEIRLYREGHFEIYLGEPFERLIRDQIDFLEAHVPVKQEAPR